MTDDQALEENHARLAVMARAIFEGRFENAGLDPTGKVPGPCEYRDAGFALAALNALSPPVPRPEVQPTFNQIHEAIHMVRKGKFLPDELVTGIILTALRHLSDTCHPETAEPPAK